MSAAHSVKSQSVSPSETHCTEAVIMNSACSFMNTSFGTSNRCRSHLTFVSKRLVRFVHKSNLEARKRIGAVLSFQPYGGDMIFKIFPLDSPSADEVIGNFKLVGDDGGTEPVKNFRGRDGLDNL